MYRAEVDNMAGAVLLVCTVAQLGPFPLDQQAHEMRRPPPPLHTNHRQTRLNSVGSFAFLFLPSLASPVCFSLVNLISTVATLHVVKHQIFIYIIFK